MSEKRIFAVAFLALAGCASTASKSVDEKLTRESHVETRADLQAEARRLIQEDPDLTSEQKARLSILSSSLTQQLNALNLESVRLRSVLVKEALSPNYKASEVQVIKDRMSGLETRRIGLMFSGLEQANVILGRGAVENRRVLNAFINDGRTGIHD